MRFFTSLIAVAAFAAAPLFAADAENTLVIEVAGENSGVVEIELLPDVAPQHVERIKRLVREGLYDDVVFHRVIPGFMAQTGDVEHGKREGFNLRFAGTGASALPNLPAEFSDINFAAGVVGMARAQTLDSANSQFFIMFDEGSFLNGQYTVVGRVSVGQDVVDAIKKGEEATNGAVADPDYMKTVMVKSDIEAAAEAEAKAAEEAAEAEAKAAEEAAEAEAEAAEAEAEAEAAEVVEEAEAEAAEETAEDTTTETSTD